MKREIVELVEAARNLKIQRCPKPENPVGIKLLGSKAEFPENLYKLALALEEVDLAGAQVTDANEDPTQDAACLRTAIDNLFKWMRSTGMDISEPYAVVAAALGAQGKPAAAFKPTPRFTQDAFKQSSRSRNLFKLAPVPGEKISLQALQAKAYEQDAIVNSLGAAAIRR